LNGKATKNQQTVNLMSTCPEETKFWKQTEVVGMTEEELQEI
jgi:hypothetical protein